MQVRWIACVLVACTQRSGSPPLEFADDAAMSDSAPDFGDPLEAGPNYDEPPDAGEPPLVACGADAATDGGECPLPRSVCFGQWLVYYSDGTCLRATCRYTTKTTKCPVGCYEGACFTPHPTN